MHYLHMWKVLKTLQVQTPAKGRKRNRMSATNGWCWTFVTVGRMSFSWESPGRWRNWLCEVHYPVNLSEKAVFKLNITNGCFIQKSTNIYKCWWTAHFNYMFKDLTLPSCLFKAKGWQGWIILVISFSSLRH